MRTHLLLLTGLLAAAGAESPPDRLLTLRGHESLRPGPGAGGEDPPRPPGPRAPGGEESSCTPGTWMYDGCNACRCTQERKIKCTSNVCREPPAASCQYGRTYLDQCNNVCFCDKFGAYQCRPRGTPGGGICYHDGVTGKPLRCEQEGFIRVEAHTQFFCQDGIVHFEYASPRAPRPAPLEFGDVVLPDYEPCPAGFVTAPGMLGVKICKAADSNVMCDDKRPTRGGECGVDDCGERYNPQRDCLQCFCLEGKPDDVSAGFNEPCPPGFDHRTSFLYFRKCGPIDDLPCSGPGTEYQVDCDLCVCQEGGVPACTHRQCDTSPEEQSCQYGTFFVDECNAVCRCVRGGGRYACGRRGCPPGRTSGKPLTCPAQTRELPRIRGLRVFCHKGVVKAQLKDGDEPNRPGQCPWTIVDIYYRCNYNKQCDDDRLCPPGHKCCREQLPCGQKCRPACAPACAPGQRCQTVYLDLEEERAECVPVSN
ncbi:Serine protease inhibitor I/II [Amphibalanus amphitrite]|uniref:Serine protease inhibitor I/II n=1 Tax=Amphibalanus amphitrite TaxID=1232801 RepID=A0A6A4V4S9_AMPAM|nr:Serine protease inhibitor I/II [Amphibalanus amphitrite]